MKHLWYVMTCRVYTIDCGRYGLQTSVGTGPATRGRQTRAQAEKARRSMTPRPGSRLLVVRADHPLTAHDRINRKFEALFGKRA